jgi:hypothetical protein
MDYIDTEDPRRGTRTLARVQTPPGVSGRRSHGALTASIRMLTARAMLRHGRDPLTIAEATHVPLALVELVRDIDADRHPRHRRAG